MLVYEAEIEANKIAIENATQLSNTNAAHTKYIFLVVTHGVNPVIVC